MIVWNNDKVCCPSLPQPDEFRWEKREDEWIAVMTKEAPAPDAIVQLIKCGCQKNRFSNNRCQCRKISLKLQLPQSVLAVTVTISVKKACEVTDTLKIEYEDSGS